MIFTVSYSVQGTQILATTICEDKHKWSHFLSPNEKDGFTADCDTLSRKLVSIAETMCTAALPAVEVKDGGSYTVNSVTGKTEKIITQPGKNTL